MGKLTEEIVFFIKASTKVKPTIQKRLNSEVRELKSAIVSASPVKTGRYKNSWRISKSSTEDSMAYAQIFNPLSYASALDYGIEKGTSHPWAISYPKNRASKGVVMSKGRIWSKQRPGGTINSVVTPSYEKRLSQSIANAIIEAF